MVKLILLKSEKVKSEVKFSEMPYFHVTNRGVFSHQPWGLREKRLFSVFACLVIFTTAYCADFVSNGIYYKFIGNNEVAVAGPPSSCAS